MERQLEHTDMCESIEQYAKKRGLPEIRCFIVTLENGAKEYAICDDKEWLYGSNLAESVAVHIDMIYLSRTSRWKKETTDG